MSEFKHINSKENTRGSISQLITLVGKLYNITPLWLRWIASPLIYCYQLFLDLRLNLWFLTGDEFTSRKELSILCATNDDRYKNYLLGLAFGTSFQERCLGRAWLWKIPKVIAETGEGFSLMIVQVRGSHHKLMRSNNWFYIPRNVVGEVDIPLDPTVMKKHTIKMDLRKIRKHSLGFEVTRCPKLFDDFYHNMYVPHITKAHSSSATIIPYKHMRKKFQKCDLLLVTKQAKRIAGTLIVYEKTGPRRWVLGIRDGNREYLKDGAVGAISHFSLRYLHDKGFTKVNLGYSKSFLRDGVLQYKRKWSQRIVGAYGNEFALKVISYTDATKAFLQKNPFIFKRHGCLHGATFVDGDDALSPEEIKQIDKQHYHPGLSKLFIYHLQHGDTVNQESVPPELLERIVLCPVKDLACKHDRTERNADYSGSV